MPNLNQFSTSKEGKLTFDDVKALMEKMQRLAFLKKEKEKTKKKLKKLTPTKIQAQAQKLTKFEAKREKFLKDLWSVPLYGTLSFDQLWGSGQMEFIFSLEGQVKVLIVEENSSLRFNNDQSSGPYNPLRRNQVPVHSIYEAEEMFKKIEMAIEARNDEYADGLSRVRGGNTLMILLPFKEEQAELSISD
uniref:Uncharacterized protein n=1 Tax=Tanacetum cinerariifolium TaxID=118510 RepID=A0A6L2M526_TANCI|nr:hypothetical protein [Tanacetum cinerariifolium]